MYRTSLSFLFLSILLTAALGQSRPSQSSNKMTVAGVVRHSRDAVVQIVAPDRAGSEISLGSGFFVTADGKIVTNYHVIRGAHSGVAKLADGSLLSVEGVLAVDTEKDLNARKRFTKTDDTQNSSPSVGKNATAEICLGALNSVGFIYRAR